MLLAFFFIEKTFKNFTCSVLILRFKNYTASVYSLKDFIVYFSMYFCCSNVWNDLHYTIPFFICQYFFRHFLKNFHYHF